MKRFLEHKIITAQTFNDFTAQTLDDFKNTATDAKSAFTPLDPKSYEDKYRAEIMNKTDAERKKLTDAAIDDIFAKNVDNRKTALSIYTSSGKSEDEYEKDLKVAWDDLKIPDFQWNQYIIGLWPMLRDKNFTFNKFKELLFRVVIRLRNPTQVDEAFKSLISVLPNLSKTLGTSDEALTKAMDFLTSGKSADEFQQYLLYHMVLKYGLTREIPEDKRTEIIKATETLEKLRSDVTSEEQSYAEYMTQKNIFLNEQFRVNKAVTLAIMAMQEQNYRDLTTLFRNGIDWSKLSIWLKMFKDGLKFGTLQEGAVFSGRAPKEGTTGMEVGIRQNHISDKVRRRVFAETPPGLFVDQAYDDAKLIADEADVQAKIKRETLKTPKETTDSGAFSELYGKNYQAILIFETVAKERMEHINKNIEFVLNKSASPTTIGPFQSGSVFQYLQNEKESLDEIERVIGLVDDVISEVSDARSTLIETIGSVDTKDTVLQRKNAKIAIEERFGIFIKDARSKQLGLKFNGVLIENENAYSEAEDLYENVKVEMESNVSARPVLAPKAILAGFRMADILENIANRFKEIAGLNPFRAEQAKKTARRFENFAKQQRAFVFKDIYPGMAASIGIEATKPSISPSLSLRGAADADMFRNIRLAGKFMDKEVESDKKFRDYWNSLFMQSKDPRPMGDIIEEKPKHGNLTTEEDAKLHKKTMRKFKKPAAKSRFKKN